MYRNDAHKRSSAAYTQAYLLVPRSVKCYPQSMWSPLFNVKANGDVTLEIFQHFYIKYNLIFIFVSKHQKVKLSKSQIFQNMRIYDQQLFTNFVTYRSVASVISWLFYYFY